MKTRSNAKSSNKRKRLMNIKVNKTAPKSIEFWTKIEEKHKRILNLVNDHKHKSEKLERFTTNF